MATLAQTVGVSVKHLYRVEAGGCRPSEALLHKICLRTGTDPGHAMAEAGLLSRRAERYLREHADAILLIEEVCSYDSGPADLRDLRNTAFLLQFPRN